MKKKYPLNLRKFSCSTPWYAETKPTLRSLYDKMSLARKRYHDYDKKIDEWRSENPNAALPQEMENRRDGLWQELGVERENYFQAWFASQNGGEVIYHYDQYSSPHRPTPPEVQDLTDNEFIYPGLFSLILIIKYILYLIEN
jgi:hypothetical protein